MKRHRGLLLALALSAVMGLSASPAQAELISITVSITGGPSLNVDALATPGATTYNVDSPGLTTLNLFLKNHGSEYTFAGLSGSSNYTGGSADGQLQLNGLVSSIRSGNSGLTITETEGGFTSPTGASGTLLSSSSATFTGQAAGAGQMASSAFNSTSTPTYSVLSTTTDPNSPGGGSSAAVAPVPTLYTLTNVLTLGLSHGSTNSPVSDSFGVSATISAVSVPEPGSLVTMLIGMPLPLVVLGLLRRRRAAA